ncbi:hypothetical protein CDCA_CDCA09G2782 [Cyanidium caldarium]|uniref:Uncharacterized protein n=1 Tax=Cyanidium caldarium TaxID=2771 RepID=A0AAV9IWS8_CYACA|nr:hypothetical protein CDCA_CDCA09G2782 [Cyanidium caldarium]
MQRRETVCGFQVAVTVGARLRPVSLAVGNACRAVQQQQGVAFRAERRRRARWLAALDRPQSPQSGRSASGNNRLLLCVELGALFPPTDKKAAADTEALDSLFERLRVHVSATTQVVTLLYFFDGSMTQARQLLSQYPTAVEGDIMCAYAGAQVFQRGYSAPDPYWEDQMVLGEEAWDLKPLIWVMRQSFAEVLKPAFDPEGYLRRAAARSRQEVGDAVALEYTIEDESVPREQLVQQVRDKLAEMGVGRPRCFISSMTGHLLVLPTRASVGACIQFVMGMLRMPPQDTILVGRASSALFHDAAEALTQRGSGGLLRGMVREMRQDPMRSASVAPAPTEEAEGAPAAEAIDARSRANGTAILLPDGDAATAAEVTRVLERHVTVVRADKAGAAGLTEALLAAGVL